MKSALLLLSYVTVVLSDPSNRQWSESSFSKGSSRTESLQPITRVPLYSSWVGSKPQVQDEGSFNANMFSQLMSKCGKNNYRCLQGFYPLGQDIDDEKWLQLVGMRLPVLLAVTTPSPIKVTPLSNFVRLQTRRKPNRPLNLTALHIKHGVYQHHHHASAIRPSAAPTTTTKKWVTTTTRPKTTTTTPRTTITTPRTITTTPRTTTATPRTTTPRPTFAVKTSTSTSIDIGQPHQRPLPTKASVVKIGNHGRPTQSSFPAYTNLDFQISATIPSKPTFTKLGSHSRPAKPIFSKPNYHIRPAISQNIFVPADAPLTSTSLFAVQLPTKTTTLIPDKKTSSPRTTRSTKTTTPIPIVRRTQRPLPPAPAPLAPPSSPVFSQPIFTAPNLKPNPTFTAPNSPASSETSIQTVHHALVFKMLLLIAFVAVPILAAAAPVLFPAGRTSRNMEDEAVVDWAAETATLLSLAHLVMDERITKLLQLGDDDFATTLSAALAESVGKLNGMDPEELQETSARLKIVFSDLLLMVKNKNKLRRMDSSSLEDNPSTEKDISQMEKDIQSTEKDNLSTETDALSRVNWNTINVKKKLWT